MESGPICMERRILGTVGPLLPILICLGGCRALFPTEAGDELQHFTEEAPALGEHLPDLSLVTTDGRRVRLPDIAAGKPVVLQLGSHSCPVYRYRRFDVRKLKEEFEGSVDFVTLYTLEAHPEGSVSPYRDEEWNPLINKIFGVRVSQPQSLHARIARAAWSSEALENRSSVLVDNMSDAGWKAFGRAPSAAFVIDEKGHVVLRQVWVEPSAIRRALRQLLAK